MHRETFSADRRQAGPCLWPSPSPAGAVGLQLPGTGTCPGPSCWCRASHGRWMGTGMLCPSLGSQLCEHCPVLVGFLGLQGRAGALTRAPLQRGWARVAKRRSTAGARGKPSSTPWPVPSGSCERNRLQLTRGACWLHLWSIARDKMQYIAAIPFSSARR